jgi:hypothetical protein
VPSEKVGGTRHCANHASADAEPTTSTDQTDGHE